MLNSLFKTTFAFAAFVAFAAVANGSDTGYLRARGLQASLTTAVTTEASKHCNEEEHAELLSMTGSIQMWLQNMIEGSCTESELRSNLEANFNTLGEIPQVNCAAEIEAQEENPGESGNHPPRIILMSRSLHSILDILIAEACKQDELYIVMEDTFQKISDSCDHDCEDVDMVFFQDGDTMNQETCEEIESAGKCTLTAWNAKPITEVCYTCGAIPFTS